jgi:hypothetical protein
MVDWWKNYISEWRIGVSSGRPELSDFDKTLASDVKCVSADASVAPTAPRPTVPEPPNAGDRITTVYSKNKIVGPTTWSTPSVVYWIIGSLGVIAIMLGVVVFVNRRI